MKKVSYIAFFIMLFLSLAACAKEADKEKPQSDSSPAEQSAAVSETAPQESEVKYQTYQIPYFEIEFDCPVDFASDIESHVISENEVYFSVNGVEADRTVLCTCSRIASLDEWAALAVSTGGDSTALYEDYQSLDVAAAIASWKEYGFKRFELLDSFSTPDSYGFYYVGEDDFGDVPGAQLGYRYKNYGSFGELNDLIRVDLQIGVPEGSMAQEDFIALCEAVTNSLRLSDAGTAAAAPSEPENGKPAMEPLKGGTYEEQCREIVDKFFQYASLIRYGAPSSDLMLLMDGNEDLFQILSEPGEILCVSHSFTSELTYQDCGQSGGGYYINVIETRGYDEEEMGTHEYLYTFSVSINSPTDYCITGVDSVYNSPVDDGYEGSASGGAAGSFVSLYDDEDGIYDGPPVDAFYKPDGTYSLNQYLPPELEAQRTYGANAQIEDSTFNYVLAMIRMGDVYWSWNAEAVSRGGNLGRNPAYDYKEAYESLERAEYMMQFSSQVKYTNTPLYELARYRYQSAVLVWGFD